MGGDGVVAYLVTGPMERGNLKSSYAYTPEECGGVPDPEHSPLILQSTHQSLLDRVEALAAECDGIEGLGSTVIAERLRRIVADAKNGEPK